MKKKKAFKNIFRFVLFLGLLAYVFILLNKFFYADEARKYEDFYREKENFDVLFFGSSRMLDAVQPMELWDDFNIRSFNMSQHSEGLARDYWQLKNALEHNHPQLVVLDISMFYGAYAVDVNDASSTAAFHKQIDHMPLSLTKIQAVTQICPRSLYMEYLFPWVLYHSNWYTKKPSDLWKQTHSVRKGAEVRTNIMPQDKFEWDKTSYADVFVPESSKLEEIIDLCSEEGVDILFICLPNSENATVMSTLNRFEQYFSDHGVNYINLATEDVQIDPSTDYSDTSHVNVAGSLKITQFLGNYFINKYKTYEVNEGISNAWNENFELYLSEKKSLLQTYKDDFTYLRMLLYSDGDFEVYVNDKGNISEIQDKNLIMEGDFEKYISEGKQLEIYAVNEASPFIVLPDTSD